jgi:2-keto-4-pentenoate hydratase
MTETRLAPTDLDALAVALRSARDQRRPISPLIEAAPGLTVADAYAIAARNVDQDIASGARRVGHKIGLTSSAVQQQLGVSSPDYGVLLDTMQVADGATIRRDNYIAPRIELEVAFVLSETLTGPGVTTDDVRRATAYVHPALELVDSRIRDWKITLPDTVADAASSAGYVVGSRRLTLEDLDIANLSGELYRGEELVETGNSSAVLGDPCAAVAWLANALAGVGESLSRGEVVLSGACTRMVAINSGDRFRGAIEGLGTVELRVAGEPA